MPLVDKRNSYKPLLVSLVALFLLGPLFGSLPLLKHALAVLFMVMLCAAFYAVSSDNKYHKLATIFVGGAVITEIARLFVDYPAVRYLNSAFEIPFLVFVTWIMFSRMIKEQEVSADTIFGSVCVYFMIGLCWGLLYAVVELVNPGSFAGSQESFNESSQLSNFLYFSLVTMTTLGYGDIVPIDRFAQSLATMQAIFGQMYIAILVARLVAIQITDSLSGKTKS